MSILEVNNLTKDFGESKGIFDINFDLSSGQILGFIGPNGAGKSTTTSILTGFVIPDSGNFKIFDRDIDHLNIYDIYPDIGILMSEVVFEKHLTPQQIFQQSEVLLDQDLTENWRQLAEYLDLDINKRFSKLSLGNRKKVGIINCLMHDPNLVIMDEPSSGLDPLVQQKLFILLKKIAQNGGGVLLSSHVLSEVQSACNQIIMIKEGKIVLQDSTEDILQRALKVFRFKTLDSEVENLLKQRELIEKIEMKSEEKLVYTNQPEEILKILVENDIFSFYLESPSLENMFLEYYK
ncbi:MAG: ABC transporter ATP-binding protein [Patescibacteria group bacterium]